MSIEDTINKLSSYIGQNWFDVSEAMEVIIVGDECCYRWLEPDTEVSPLEVRSDRINIHVDSNIIIQKFTIG